MASITLEVREQLIRTVKVFKPMTTIGSGKDNDVPVEGADLEPTHAQLIREPDGLRIVAMTRDMTVNGRREKEKKLEDRDVIRLGALKMVYYALDADAPEPRPVVKIMPKGVPAIATQEVVSAYRRIHAFSMKLLENASTTSLVETLLDAIIDLTGADKGFLVLLDPAGEPSVVTARNVGGANVDASIGNLSDSILRKVIETKAPLVVADALRDDEFNSSASVVNLQLLSVMCCPLLELGRKSTPPERDAGVVRGQPGLEAQVRGLIYVGNNHASNVFDTAALDIMNVFAAQASLLLSETRRIDELTTEKAALTARLEGMRFGSILGACDSMKEIYKRIRKVATTDISVLVTGETGTGKELIAREIHAGSRRKNGPFVTINCGAIPANLLESELFGHVRGAFTGAVSAKIGRFQAADGGTLFLDEIGEMPPFLQVKILRALQDHLVTRVGDTKNEAVDIRVIAATNRVLDDEIKAGRFREDLYYRLNVVGIHLPPLRERGDDVVALAKYLLQRTVAEQSSSVRGFSKSCLAAIRAYRWPGNVRQLENKIKKAVVMAEARLLTADDMDIRAEDIEEILPLATARERFQTRYIQEVLDRNGGNRTKTARDLGVDPRTIFRHLEKLSSPIPPEDGIAGLEVEPGAGDADAFEPEDEG